ncbi:MAG: tetratricopeptide repeat protein [Acidobacteria bacterium]|nr:tetratricopeptide repeat protein [Acidobacteriota bacterium]
MDRPRRSALILALALALVASRAVAQTEEANNLLGQAGPGVIAVIAYGPDKAEILKGSALALSEDVVVTAYHVVSRAADADGLNIKGKKVKIEGLIGADKAHDIALLKLKGKVQALPIGSVDGLTPGARLFALGSNGSGQVVIAEGTFRRLIDAGEAGKLLEVSIPVPEPFRGGPLLDINGQLVGMLLVLDRGFKVGVPVASLVSVIRAPKAAEFKSQAPEDYFETIEGNLFAGRAALAFDEQMTARLHMEKIVKLDPANLAGHLQLAQIYTQQRDYTAAAASYRKVTQLDPSRGEAFYGLGQILMKQTQYKDAAEAFEKAAAQGQSGPEVQLELGAAFEAQQDWAKAAAAYERAAAAAPPEAAAAAKHRLGVCRTNLGEYDQAVAALLEAQQGLPKDLKVREALADAYAKAGRLENAEAVYFAMAELNPNEAKNYYRQLYQTATAAGRHDRAVPPLKRIIELDPKNETNFYYLGMAYFNHQKYDEAVAAFRDSLALKPDYEYAWYQIGSSYFQAKKFKEAAEAYKKYVEIKPDDASGWMSIGVSYLQAKNFEAAIEPLKKCTELKPNDGVALANLAIAYINLKDTYSAKEIYNKLLTIDPAQAEKLKKYIR